MPNYLFLKKKVIINFMDFFEKRVFFGNFKNKKLLIYRNAEIIGNMHLFPLHNVASPMPVG